ncbi:hypothetical protein ES703_25468 [subsurface metagenome]
MAKLKGPLFSLGASQQLGKALVYFGWKGLDLVREYVVPANPRTTLQVTQRGYLSDAVEAIHTAQADATNPLDEADVVAYGLWASVVQAATTWFNQAVRNFIDVLVAGNLPCVCSAGELDNTTAGQLDAEVYLWEATCTAGVFRWGTSKTALINSETATITTQTAAATISGLTAGVKYFVQFVADVGDPCEGAKSGIYTGYAT